MANPDNPDLISLSNLTSFSPSFNMTSDFNYTKPPCSTIVDPPPAPYYAYIYGYFVFPIVFAVGFTGNFLNLLVLNSRGMKSKANYLLSAMAVSDMGFFVFMFLFNLDTYEGLRKSTAFMEYVYWTKIPFTTFLNWFSSASIWFAVMVTVERLVAIRTPLHAGSFLKGWRIVFVILVIFVCTFTINIYNVFWLRPGTMPDCKDVNKTNRILRRLTPNNGYYLFKYVTISQVVTPVITVPLPLIFLVVMNALLLYYLKVSRRYVAKMSTNCIGTKTKNEMKITLMVLVIVLAFVIFNFPSTVVYFYAMYNPKWSNGEIFAKTTNYMVTLNKALNFWLYCLASESFRKKLRILCRRKTKDNYDHSTSVQGVNGPRFSLITAKIPTIKHGSIPNQYNSPYKRESQSLL